MKYGYFSKDGLEFVITDPNTPRPWINYLTNESYCAIISQCAGGYSFYRDCRTDRILRWLPENWHFDRPGRFLYIKEDSKAWSATYQPMRVKPKKFQARHGLGYTKIETDYQGINTQAAFFVPEKDECEVWLYKITNTTNKKRNFTVFPYAEWLLGDYHEELRYRNIMNLYNRIWYDKAHKAIFAKKTASWGETIQDYEFINFMASSLSINGYATQKYDFLGKYNTEEKPQMVLGEFRNSQFCSGEDGVAVFKSNITLKPKQSKEFVVILGQTESVKRFNELFKKYKKVSNAKKELKATQALWKKRIADNIVVETPDKDFNTMMNIWVKYQVYICNFWSRSPSYYHEGSGGRGYRDSCQDAESICSINPEHTRKKILTIAALIRRDGTSAPGFSDTKGPAQHRPNRDHQIWLTPTVLAYIKETGDLDILQEYVPYLKDKWLHGWEIDANYKGGPKIDGEGTLFEHLEKNLNFCFDDVGPRGFPLIGHADWNDAIDSAGKKLKGDSVWLAQALVRSMKMFVELCELAGEKEKAKSFRSKIKTMSERINDEAWDGQWYVRGFTDGGFCYGSKKNKYGKIFLNTQSWSILSGVCEGSRLNKVINSVDKHLNGAHGLALFAPAYSEFDPRLGRISMFSEGTKENAAVFCHAATFMAVALCQAGRGDLAYEAMKKIMPNAQKNYDLYETEPYVYAEYLVGPEHPYLYGQGAFTWITGTSGWNFMCGTEWICGARRESDGLLIDPCIPRKWKKFSIRRPFKGAVYDIFVKNPKGVEKGVEEIRVDGLLISGQLIKPHSDGKVHKVEVLMGRP